jgi:hypothetical protein
MTGLHDALAERSTARERRKRFIEKDAKLSIVTAGIAWVFSTESGCDVGYARDSYRKDGVIGRPAFNAGDWCCASG